MDIVFDKSKLKTVPLSKIRPNSWNPKRKEDGEDFAEVKRSIELHGFRQPIIVRENDGYEIIDGEQRWTAAKQLNYREVPIYDEGEMDELTAKELTIAYQTQVPFQQVQIAVLLKEMTDAKPDARIPYSPEKMDDFAQLLSFNWEDFEGTELTIEDSEPVLSARVDSDQLSEIKKILRKKAKGQTTRGNFIRREKLYSKQEQMDIILSALTKIEDEHSCNRARALELLCADYLSGYNATK